MSVEILTVSLSDESAEKVAQLVVARLKSAGYEPTTQSNPYSAQNPQDAEASGFQQSADPWEAATPAPPVQTGQPQYQNQRRAPAAPGTMPSGDAPYCQHGQRRPIAAGVNQAGKSYGPGWSCPAPRGQQCPPVWSR